MIKILILHTESNKEYKKKLFAKYKWLDPDSKEYNLEYKLVFVKLGNKISGKRFDRVYYDSSIPKEELKKVLPKKEITFIPIQFDNKPMKMTVKKKIKKLKEK